MTETCMSSFEYSFADRRCGGSLKGCHCVAAGGQSGMYGIEQSCHSCYNRRWTALAALAAQTALLTVSPHAPPSSQAQH